MISNFYYFAVKLASRRKMERKLPHVIPSEKVLFTRIGSEILHIWQCLLVICFQIEINWINHVLRLAENVPKWIKCNFNIFDVASSAWIVLFVLFTLPA